MGEHDDAAIAHTISQRAHEGIVENQPIDHDIGIEYQSDRRTHIA
jgi:hypothetical protein